MMFAKRFIVSALLGLAVPAAAPAQPITAGCSPNKMEYVASDGKAFHLTASDYADLPQARMVIRQGGNRNSCVIVRFSANADADGVPIGVRAVLNEVTTALPSELQFSDGNDNGPDARRFVFVFDSVPPGQHPIRIQYRLLGTGNADMNAHNLIVWYTR